MELIRGLHNLRAKHRTSVATIGNFDGVHLGHRAVIAQVLARAKSAQLPSTVIVFEPQPLEYVAPDMAPYRITRFREKLRLLEQLGIDQVLCLQFNRRLQDMQPMDFIAKILVNGLDVQHFVVGDDFCFGKNRTGNFAMLQQAGEEFGFGVENTHTCQHNGLRVSSTEIRKALGHHDFEAARQLLGRVFEISGKVAKGQQLGRTIGVPTANIRLHNKTPAVQGVYATKVHGIGDQAFLGVANVGRRPTVSGDLPQLEVHIFDLDQNLYGQYLRVEFCHFIRREMTFAGLSELQQQIANDIAKAKAYFSILAIR